MNKLLTSILIVAGAFVTVISFMLVVTFCFQDTSYTASVRDEAEGVLRKYEKGKFSRVRAATSLVRILENTVERGAIEPEESRRYELLIAEINRVVEVLNERDLSIKEVNSIIRKMRNY